MDNGSPQVQPMNPTNERLSAQQLSLLQRPLHESLTLIFSPLNRQLKLSPYPIRRALPIVEATSRDFNDIPHRILTSHRLAYAPQPTFERLLAQTTALWMWDDLIRGFTNVAREVTRKRSEKFNVVPTHGKLVERVRCLRESRK